MELSKNGWMDTGVHVRMDRYKHEKMEAAESMLSVMGCWAGWTGI